MTTSIEVIDTAVKIGLGSLITIGGAYVITRLNHDHENAREKRRRYLDAGSKELNNRRPGDVFSMVTSPPV